MVVHPLGLQGRGLWTFPYKGSLAHTGKRKDILDARRPCLETNGKDMGN
jgi:hypothetical protein